MVYVTMPFIAWCVAGCVKFAINFLRFGQQAKSLIGYGGFPSTHTTIMSSVVFLVGFTEGFATPLFSVGMGALLVLIIDAHGLRRKIGEQASVLNSLQDAKILRERMGHSWIEILGGLVLGIVLAKLGSIVMTNWCEWMV